MLRRHFLGAASAAALSPLAMPRLARAQGESVLRFVPFVDLSLLDPIATTATPTRNHAFMIFDTLYGLDANFQPQPQMVSGHVIEDDGKLWKLTLRDGLKFHDGEPVRGRDCVASIKRWAQRDAMGQILLSRTAEMSAPADDTFVVAGQRFLEIVPAKSGTL